MESLDIELISLRQCVEYNPHQHLVLETINFSELVEVQHWNSENIGWAKLYMKNDTLWATIPFEPLLAQLLTLNKPITLALQGTISAKHHVPAKNFVNTGEEIQMITGAIVKSVSYYAGILPGIKSINDQIFERSFEKIMLDEAN